MNANKVFLVLDSPLFRRMYSVGYWSTAIVLAAHQACMRGHDVYILHEPRHDKTNKMSVRPSKTQISLGIRPV